MGSSGVTVDNQSDPPAAVTTLVAPGAVLSDGQADFSAVGGEQRIRLLGPYTAEFDTPDFVDPLSGGATIGTIPADVLILRTMVQMVTAFDGITDSTACTLDIWTGSNEEDPKILVSFNNCLFMQSDGTGNGLYGLYPSSEGLPTSTSSIRGTEVEVPLTVAFFPDNGPCTQGELEVYLLIAEPAV